MIKVKVAQVCLHSYSETSVLRFITISSGKRRDSNLQQPKPFSFQLLKIHRKWYYLGLSTVYLKMWSKLEFCYTKS